MTLFGINIARLFLAIAQVESECGSSSPNVYQLTPIYLADVNRILQNGGKLAVCSYRLDDARDQRRSEDAMRVYWTHYGTRYAYLTGMVPSPEVLARIHNGGPDGWRNPDTEAYWAKVYRRLQIIEADEAEAWVRGGNEITEMREVPAIHKTTKLENENGSKRRNRNRPRISNQRAAY